MYDVNSMPTLCCKLGIPVYSGNFSENMRAVLAQNMWEKYAEFGEICAKICGVYAALLKYVACLRWTKCAEMLKNAIAYAEICINRYSKCINKYSKF